MDKFYLSGKTLVDTYIFSNIGGDRRAKVQPMTWTDYEPGILYQSITIVGNIYEDCDGKRMVMIGINKEDPECEDEDIDASIEKAMLNAIDDPIMVIYLHQGDNFTYDQQFAKLVKLYLSSTELEFKILNNQTK